MSEEEQSQESEKLEFSGAEAANTLPKENAADDQKNSLPEPEISTMEVHHHPHAQHKKKWKDYVFEFLLLFLAVFCGFLAEYQLEHTIEQNREKQYIRSFAEDLSADDGYTERRIMNFTEKIKIADSLVLLLSTMDKNDRSNDIYYFYLLIGRHGPFDVNDRTIVQLRNAGGMRLISNKRVSDSMVSYYRAVENIKYLDARLVERIGTLGVHSEKIFDAIDWGKLTDTVNNNILKVKGPLKIRTKDPDILNAAIMNIQRIKNITIANRQAIRRLREKGIVVRKFVLKEYKLE